MIPLTLKEFGGQLPAWDDRYLPDNQASFAQNTFLYSGAIIGWRQPKLLRALNDSTAKFAYRVPTINQGIASGVLAFLQNAIEGDLVSIGEYNYKFTATVTNPYDVLLGASALASAQNFFLAINFGAQDTAICGIATLPNTNISANNPYLGYPFSGTASTNIPGANTLVLVKCNPSGTQKLTSINFMPAATSAGAKFTGVIYNNVNSVEIGGNSYVDQPSTLADTGLEVVGCTAGTPVTSTLTVPITLTGGGTYWIGFIMDTAVAFAQASATANAISIPNTYTNGPPNPITGTEVTPLKIATGQPNYQIWGAMATIASTDPINTIGTNDFGTGSIPYISVDAPDFGAAYNNTELGEITSSARMAWVAGLTGLTLIPTMSGGANQSLDATITGASQWLEFEDPFTTVIKSPVVDDSYKRYYIVSPSQPPQYTTYQRIVEGDSTWLLGVPPPGCAPTVDPANGGNLATTLGFPTSTSSNTAAFSPGTLYLTKVISTGQGSVTDINVAIASLTGGGTLYTGGGTTNIDVTYELLGSPGSTKFDHLSGTGVFILNPLPSNVQPLTGALVLSAVIYSDSNNTPSELIAVAAPGVTSGSTPETITCSFVTPPNLTANTSYWIGILFNSSGTVQLADDFGLAGSLTTLSGTPPIMAPTNAPAMASGQQDWQIWADIDNTQAIIESRAYVYTWVTEYGEEGPPSPPTLADGWNNGIWSIGLFPPLPDEMGVTRNIVKTNIYRTVTGTGGGTTFFLVAAVDVTQGSYVDASTDNIIAENLILPSTNWFPPPEGLQGIYDMPNGMIVGFKGNEIWFCEPYRPHAWPPGYVLTTEFPIVGLGITGQSIVACTSSSPAVAVGASPSVMSLIKMFFPEPCLHRGSIISNAGSVLYASANGLISVNQGGATNLSQPWITREKWTKYAPQQSLVAIPLMGSYFAFGTTNTGVTTDAQRGFTLELNSATDSQGFGQWPQIGGHRLGLQQLTAPGAVNIDNVMLDPWSSAALLIQGGNVYYYDFQDQAPQIQTATWRSKKYQTSHKDSFSAMRVWFDIPPGGPQTPPSNQTFADPTFTNSVGLPYATGMFGIVRVLADGKYVMERELRYSSEMMRIPDGFKATTWQWEYQGIVSVTIIKAATSAKELGLGVTEGR